jgi:uncharacterized metal-binding protein YceD (DUF177 family)
MGCVMSSGLINEFEINIHRLENGMHDFEFSISDSFFELFPLSIIKQGEGVIQLSLDKSTTMMVLHFIMDVSVRLVCDISLEEFNHLIKVEQDLMVKFGDRDEEMSEDIIMIQQDRQAINVAEYIYQFLNLHVPMKKVHPKLEGADRPDLAYVSDQEQTKDEDYVDPRWEALKKLKK